MNLRAELDRIEELLGVKFTVSGASCSLKLMNLKNNSPISIDVDFESQEKLGEESGEVSKDDVCLVSVYTSNCHLQLQNCSRIIISSMLEEMIFISESGNFISGLIISKQGDCSLYSNVDKKTLSSDFTGLSSEKLLSAVALSVTEMDISN